MAESAIHLKIYAILKRIQSKESCGRLNDRGQKECHCTAYESKNDFDLKCKNCDHVHKEFNSYEDLDKLPCILILVSFVEESMSLVGVFLLNFCRSLFNFLMFVSCFQSSYRSISLVSWGKVFSLFQWFRRCFIKVFFEFLIILTIFITELLLALWE